MQLTTCCYIEGPEGILMLHRVKKGVDINKGKWIGIGGRMESGESPAECVVREVKEETGLLLEEPRLAAVITFQFLNPAKELADWETEYMFLFTCRKYSGEVDFSCSEGDLAWVPKEALKSLPMWEGDPLFMAPALAGAPFFSMKLVYRGDELLSWSVEP